MSDHFDEMRTSPPTLAGATILQIVPALREGAPARTAVDIARTLLQAGGRALIAGGDGPLVDELKTYGGEWVSLASEAPSPCTRNRNVGMLQNIYTSEHVDIVHAQGAGGAAAARRASSRSAVWLVTTLPDVPPASSREFAHTASLTHGDRIIAPSIFAANPVIDRFALPREQITIIPRSVDTVKFDARTVAK